MKKYWTVASMGWQDSLVYRLNALVWVLYAVLPSLTLMLVWIAAYSGKEGKQVGGYDLQQMITYYLVVTALSVAITPHPEWEMSQLIRDGKITPFIVRPIGFFGHKFAQETSYQVIKTTMFLPALALLVYLFREYIELQSLSPLRGVLFAVSALLAYVLLTQLKFLLGISAFWLAEVGGLMEIGNIMLSVFGGRLLPLQLLPSWIQSVNHFLPFASFYAFPMEILMPHTDSSALVQGFARQAIWIVLFAAAVRWTWKRGLLAYEGYGG